MMSYQVCRSRLVVGLLIAFCRIDPVYAQNPGQYWSAVGISWAISTSTTIFIVLLAFTCHHCLYHKKHHSYHDRSDDDAERASLQTFDPTTDENENSAPSKKPPSSHTAASVDSDETDATAPSKPIQKSCSSKYDDSHESAGKSAGMKSQPPGRTGRDNSVDKPDATGPKTRPADGPRGLDNAGKPTQTSKPTAIIPSLPRQQARQSISSSGSSSSGSQSEEELQKPKKTQPVRTEQQRSISKDVSLQEKKQQNLPPPPKELVIPIRLPAPGGAALPYGAKVEYDVESGEPRRSAFKPPDSRRTDQQEAQKKAQKQQQQPRQRDQRPQERTRSPSTGSSSEDTDDPERPLTTANSNAKVNPARTRDGKNLKSVPGNDQEFDRSQQGASKRTKPTVSRPGVTSSSENDEVDGPEGQVHSASESLPPTGSGRPRDSYGRKADPRARASWISRGNRWASLPDELETLEARSGSDASVNSAGGARVLIMKPRALNSSDERLSRNSVLRRSSSLTKELPAGHVRPPSPPPPKTFVLRTPPRSPRGPERAGDLPPSSDRKTKQKQPPPPPSSAPPRDEDSTQKQTQRQQNKNSDKKEQRKDLSTSKPQQAGGASSNFIFGQGAPGPKQTSTPDPVTPHLVLTSSRNNQDRHDDDADTENGAVTKETQTRRAFTKFLTPRNQHEFHGMLSDDGLRDMAVNVRNEWRHLANALRINSDVISTLIERYESKPDRRVYEMLHGWRDGYTGSKQQVRAALSDAMVVIERPEMAEQLVQEEMIGSEEDLNGIKLVSVV